MKVLLRCLLIVFRLVVLWFPMQDKFGLKRLKLECVDGVSVFVMEGY